MKSKDNKKPQWEYGHRREIGKDGKLTGRTISYRCDQKTGKVEEEIHTQFQSN